MNLQKREKGNGVPTASPMLKLAKRIKKIKRPIDVDKTTYLFLLERGGGGGGVLFIFEFFLDFWKDNPIISSDRISHSLLETNSPLFLEG